VSFFLSSSARREAGLSIFVSLSWVYRRQKSTVMQRGVQGITYEEVLAEFGLTPDDLQKQRAGGGKDE
jgi:hypothetical protein